jgi:hypothetical protein
MNWIIGRQDWGGVWFYLAAARYSWGETWTPNKQHAKRFDNREEANTKHNELKKRGSATIWVIDDTPAEREDVTFSVTVSIAANHNERRERIAELAIPVVIERLEECPYEWITEIIPTEL